MRAVQTATAVDAFTAEVIRNAVVAITGEMKTNLMRTAYSDGEIVAFSASMAHWPDVGGVLGGVTRDIYAEGL